MIILVALTKKQIDWGKVRFGSQCRVCIPRDVESMVPGDACSQLSASGSRGRGQVVLRWPFPVSLCVPIETPAKGMVPPTVKAFSHQLVLYGNTLKDVPSDVFQSLSKHVGL